MKIGVSLDDYTPQDGGAHTFQGEVLSALKALARDSRHEFVVLGSMKASEGGELENNRIRYLRVRKPNIFAKAIAFVARNWPNFREGIGWSSSFEKQARKAGVEFIWFVSARPKEVDIPYMTIVWDLQHRVQPWFPEVSRWGQWDIRERGYRRFLNRASAVIAGTEAGKDEITRFYGVPEERIHILPHPTPSFALMTEEGEQSDVVAKFKLPERYLLYPAQFWPHKNHLNLLRALKILREEMGSDLGLVFVGSDFGNKEYVEEKAEEWGLKEQVRFLGFVDEADLIGLYRKAFALSYLSYFGPENLPPLEAMALGCPVIAARVAGAEEQLGEAVILVDPSDPQAIAKAISDLAKKPKLRDGLIEKGKVRAAKWTSNDFVGTALKIFDQFESVRSVWRE